MNSPPRLIPETPLSRRGVHRTLGLSGHGPPGPEFEPAPTPVRALTVSRGRESNPQETDLQSVALTILPPRHGRGQRDPA